VTIKKQTGKRMKAPAKTVAQKKAAPVRAKSLPPVPSIASQAARYQRVALMLQGGGALGAYQVGVYKALAQAECLPNWICGVSIGAINGALIAGNAPEKRVARLEEFWSSIASQSPWPALPASPFEPLDMLRGWSNSLSAWMTLTTGQPGFFRPRSVNPWLLPAGASGATSFYDSSELHTTLKRLIDFGRLNHGDIRLSVGAVNVANGNGVYFDTAREALTVEHIMASGALPPALPMVQVGNAHYWDGGIVSNTPLQHLFDEGDDQTTLAFQVDLFSATGPLPTQMPEVLARQKDIVYSSRTRQATTAMKRTLSLRHQLADALQRVPANRLRPGEAQLMHDYADTGVVNLVEIIYQSKQFEGDSKDYEFSPSSMKTRMQAGYADTLASLAQPHWLDLPTPEQGVVEHDVHRAGR
jgi:NTE family protein